MKRTIMCFYEAEKTIILLFFVLWCFNASCQIKVDTVTCSFYNEIIRQHQTVEIYTITNNTQEEYLSWVSSTPTLGLSSENIINDYFKKRKGSFSYIQWMYEEDIARPESNWTIGFTFLKSIKPNETFTYVVEMSEDKVPVYQDRIVIIAKEEVDKCLKHIHLKEEYFFPWSIVLLSE